MRQTVIAILAAFLAAGCAGGTDAPDHAERFPVALTAEQEQGVLALVNDCATTLEILDVDAALNARAAANIVAHRDGADGVCGTADDDRFDDLAELDAVPYVGDSALNALLEYATARGLVTTAGGSGEAVIGTFDGVAFTATEASRTLALANGATLAELDDKAALDSRAATNIVAKRPFETTDLVAGMNALAAVSYVGGSALEALKAFAATWGPSCPSLGGTFEGVVYDDAQAYRVLDLANNGGSGDLEMVSGIGPTLASRIVAARPLGTITALGAVSGIGSSVLASLRDQTAATWCTTARSSCTCGGTAGGNTGGNPGGDTGSGGSGDLVYDGVTFTQTEAETALTIVNQADRDQLYIDGGFALATSDTLIQGRPYADLSQVAAISGWGTTTMTRLHTYATNGMWQGPGVLVNITTISEILAGSSGWNGKIVSISRLSLTWTKIDDYSAYFKTFTAYAKDPGASGTIRLSKYLCSEITETCDVPSVAGLLGGDEARLLKATVRVNSTTGEKTLDLGDQSVFYEVGCSAGYTRQCGVDVGVCSVGTETCQSDDTWSQCTGTTEQLDVDVCDGLDNDCDGAVDEDGTAMVVKGTLPGEVLDVHRRGTHAYAVNGTDHLSLDLSDPSAPRVLESRPRPEGGLGRPRVFGGERWTAIADSCAVKLFGATDSTLTPRHSLSADELATGCASWVAFEKDTVWVAASTGLFAFELSGAAPVKRWAKTDEGYRYVAHRAGFLLTITRMSPSLNVWDLRSGAPVLISRDPLGTSAYQAALTDGGLLIVANTFYLDLFDVSDPTSVRSLPSYTPTESVNATAAMAVVGAVVARLAGDWGSRSIELLDFTDPSAPKPVGHIRSASSPGVRSLAEFDGAYLFATDVDGARIYSVGSICR